ncbi:hypothetical protein [Streptomyces aidingensis]|uniref:Uncharacterized protein n=1 Tax=Streptomyces aidingensis TaxID=910347 RepID=A0A1I1Q4A1_9ACTN|nr:hypothetical protein [Streptomyces aidingensis]SFD14698.1 hypothetical protein SAMN05421773_110138 [Streptomyces aidingensis]
MNTTLAAAKANRTVATIRTWCRMGAVAAVKTGHGWDIDEASLEYRISLDKPAAPKPLTADDIIAIGGRRWTKAGKDRVYLNNIAGFIGLELTHYRTGNVSSAALNGRGIANGRAAGIASAVQKLYFDVAEGRLVALHYGARAYEVRYLNGDRETVDLVAAAFAGVEAAVAAL